MKITKLTIDKNFQDNGLPKLEFNRLGNIVILAGKNGSGKSRILRAIQGAAAAAATSDSYENAASKIKSRTVTIAALEAANKTEQDSGQHKERIRQIQTFRSRIEAHAKTIADYEKMKTDPEQRNSPIICVDFLPKSTNLKDERALRDQERENTVKEIYNLGSGNLAVAVTSLLRIEQTKYFEATHPESSLSEAEKAEAIASYARLNNLIEAFLGVRLGRNGRGQPTLFEKHVSDADLSDGQKILLQLCAELFAQHASLKSVLLFLDEPENHLHPGACIEMIESIRRAAPTCQIWMATHSLSVISYYSDATLIFVDQGEARFAGSVPEKVFTTLLGDDERVGRLRDFISLPSVFAMNKFGAECVLPPSIVGASESDAQTEQIRNHLDQLRSAAPNSKLRILDYGAGKGRLLDNLATDWPTSLSSCDYCAFDEYPADESTCRKVIESVYGSSQDRYFGKLHELRAKRGKGSLDVIILCNVLHEIDPANWTKLFGSEGDLVDLLGAQGAFLIVEDEEIPIGEKAHPKGFIVLDTAELRALFQIDSGEPFPVSDHRNNGRLKAHVITCDQAMRVTTETRRAALKERIKRAEHQIMEARASGKTDFATGRRHAFWVHQFANASLALREL